MNNAHTHTPVLIDDPAFMSRVIDTVDAFLATRRCRADIMSHLAAHTTHDPNVSCVTADAFDCVARRNVSFTLLVRNNDMSIARIDVD